MWIITWLDCEGRKHFEKIKDSDLQKFVEDMTLIDGAHQIQAYQI